MPITIQVADQYGNLGPLFPARLGRIVYQRNLQYSDTDFASSSGGTRTWVISIPQMDVTKGFLFAYQNLPDGDNRWFWPSYMDRTDQPNKYFIGLSGAYGTWDNAAKTLTQTLSSSTYPGGGVPVITYIGYRFA